MFKMSSSSDTNNVATYTWVITNFSNSRNENSPNFGFPIDNGTQFHLYLNSTSPIATISIVLDSCKQDTLKVKHRMSIVNTKGDKCNTREGIKSRLKKASLSAQYSIRQSILKNPALGLLANDTLTIFIEIELANKEAQAGDFNAMSKHYESLFESGKHSDVVLSVGEKDFHVHKAILSARSPVFEAMFDHSDTKEAQQGRVEIVDFSLEAFELFLRYLYTNKIEQLDRFAWELMAAAEKYQMDCLKSLCERFLCSCRLTTDTVAQGLTYADMYRAEAFKCKCIDYIVDNSDKVRATEGWKAVAEDADLLAILFDKMSVKLNHLSK